VFGSGSFSASSFSQIAGGNVSVALTGVSARALTPNPVEENGGAITENSFAEAPFASENSAPFVITVDADGSVSVTGLQATGQVSGVIFNATANLTGLSGTGSVGSIAVVESKTINVTGVAATGIVGGNAAESGGALFGGLSFAEEPFAGLADDIDSTIDVATGVSGSVTGVSATGAVGTASVTGDGIVPVTGVAGTGAVGSATAEGGAIVSVTGVSATGALSGVTVAQGTGVNVAVNSPRLQGQVGIVTPNAELKVFVTGVAGTGQIAGASVVSWNEIIPNQDPNWVEIAA